MRRSFQSLMDDGIAMVPIHQWWWWWSWLVYIISLIFNLPDENDNDGCGIWLKKVQGCWDLELCCGPNYETRHDFFVKKTDTENPSHFTMTKWPGTFNWQIVGQPVSNKGTDIVAILCFINVLLINPLWKTRMNIISLSTHLPCGPCLSTWPSYYSTALLFR